MKTLIAIPCMEQLPYRFVESLVSIMPVGEIYIRFLSGSLIYDARNKLALSAIEEDMDYILWLDSDMVFDGDILQRMFKSIGDKDYLSGLAFTRRVRPYRPCIYKSVGYDHEGDKIRPYSETYFDYPKDSLIEIEGSGLACCLMKVSMVKDILERYGLPFSPAIGFGEDLSFCMKAREGGYKLYADTSIKVGHIGSLVVDEELYEEVLSHGRYDTIGQG